MTEHKTLQYNFIVALRISLRCRKVRGNRRKPEDFIAFGDPLIDLIPRVTLNLRCRSTSANFFSISICIDRTCQSSCVKYGFAEHTEARSLCWVWRLCLFGLPRAFTLIVRGTLLSTLSLPVCSSNDSAKLVSRRRTVLDSQRTVKSVISQSSVSCSSGFASISESESSFAISPSSSSQSPAPSAAPSILTVRCFCSSLEGA